MVTLKLNIISLLKMIPHLFQQWGENFLLHKKAVTYCLSNVQVLLTALNLISSLTFNSTRLLFHLELCMMTPFRKYPSANYDLDHRDPDDVASDPEPEAGEVSTTSSEKHEDKSKLWDDRTLWILLNQVVRGRVLLRFSKHVGLYINYTMAILLGTLL